MLGRLVALSSLLLLGVASRHALAEPRVAFKFSAGSTLFAEPGLGAAGDLYVGGADGYVHALTAEGGYRWSYTVQGRVLAAPIEEPSSGRVFVATSERKLYALERDSHLRWVFPLPVSPKSELLLTPKGTLLFVGQDDYLYGVTTGGFLNLRLAATAARSAPTWLMTGQVALVLGDNVAVVKGYGYERSPMASVFDAGAKLALAENRSILSCSDGTARAVGDAPRLEVASDCLAPPVRADGFYALAEASDAVRLVHDDGHSDVVSLGATPLRPRWDGARRRLILTTATGDVTVLELSR